MDINQDEKSLFKFLLLYLFRFIAYSFLVRFVSFHQSKVDHDLEYLLKFSVIQLGEVYFQSLDKAV
jgi:hypothetical protein